MPFNTPLDLGLLVTQSISPGRLCCVVAPVTAPLPHPPRTAGASRTPELACSYGLRSPGSPFIKRAKWYLAAGTALEVPQIAPFDLTCTDTSGSLHPSALRRWTALSIMQPLPEYGPEDDYGQYKLPSNRRRSILPSAANGEL